MKHMRLRKMACVAIGHKLVSGRTFLAEGISIDLKWKACRRCFEWFPEGGSEQVEHEIEQAIVKRRETDEPEGL